MDWFAPVDIYCERIGTGLWAEPVNALSNAAFLLAALWAALEARRRGENARLIRALIAVAALIGIGSFLFHTFANRWSELADTLPIWGFVSLYIYVAIDRLGGRKPHWSVAVALIAAFLALAWVSTGEGDAPATSAPDPLNGSGQYFPAVAALAIFTAVTWLRKHLMRGWIAGASALFAVSLTLRTLDRDICDSFAIGTHFAWHLFNGAMIALLLQAVVRSPAASRRTAQG